MKGKDRAGLRADAHHLSPTVHVGQHGITPPLIASLDDALRTQELVKVKLGKNADLKAKDAAAQLASATDSEIIQVIGHTATFFRENPELRKKKPNSAETDA
ncbi:MAG TPA: YhbY family RNA-binding protein [Gemmatimonadaceae bacterium]|nr:YhbY family RNA-binding protein [Gemmatimonadaceae bacterium]